MAFSAENPLVSVIVPLYNKAEHVPTLMRCVLSQDVDSLELICVDDCSTDRSAQMVRDYAEKDPRVHLVRHDINRGPGAARNTGLDHARGTFVAYLDADDWYNDETYLRRLCHGALENGVLAAGSTLCNVYSDTFIERKYPETPMWSGYAFTENGVVDFRDYQFEYGSPRFVYARSLFLEGGIRYDDRRFFEDPPIMVRLLHRAGSFYADAHAEYMYYQEYRRDAWTTRKVCDLLDGIRMNLDFSREHDLAKLHWVTVNHLEWESSDVSIGIRGDIDVDAVDQALKRVEAAIDRDLINRFEPGWDNFQPLLRERVDTVRQHGRRALGDRMLYRFLHTRLWYAARLARDERRYRNR